MKVVFSQEDIQKVINHLMNFPYKDIAGVIQILSNGEKMEDKKSKDEK